MATFLWEAATPADLTMLSMWSVHRYPLFFFLGVLITIVIVIITSEFKTMIIIILVPHYHRYNDHYLHILFSVIIAYYHHLSHLNLCIRCRHHHPGHLNLFTPCHHHHLPLRLIFCVRVYHHRPYLFFSRLFCRKSHSFYTGGGAELRGTAEMFRGSCGGGLRRGSLPRNHEEVGRGSYLLLIGLVDFPIDCPRKLMWQNI